MTYQAVAEMLDDIKIDYAYYQFPEGTGQACPFICFFYSSSNDVYADNSNYTRITNLIVELYTDNKDFSAEASVESVLTGEGLTYTKDETWLDSERMHETIYTMEVLIDG